MLRYVCNKIGDGFDVQRNYRSANNRNNTHINNNMSGNDCLVGQEHGLYSEPTIEFNYSIVMMIYHHLIH